ncbi:MAG: putative Ig domain-containing protein, partial [Acidobacteria bacterium]|nr:putative Ig domain-containing protein [Acidobacteriota bacterium]
MKRSARRYQIAMLGLLPALLSLTIFAHRMVTATRSSNFASIERAANTAAHSKTIQPTRNAATNASTMVLAPAQSGGAFTLVKAAVTSGGEYCANGAFSLQGTAGQFSADLLAGGTFSISGGLLGGGGGALQCPVITITPTSLPTATLNAVYDQTLTASGGVAPYSFDIISVTSPPAGLRFNPAGTLSGSPAEAGLFPFTVRATDANGCTATQSYTLLVQPASIVVNTTADTVVADGFCSLREALQAANTNVAVNECAAGNPGLDIIAFDLGPGTPRIDVTGTLLPFITETIVLDGAAGPGGATRVELNGVQAGANADGLDLRATDSTLRSLVINRFSRDGIVIRSFQNKVENCLIGTDALAAADQGNQRYGIYLLSPSNMIGGTAPGTRNVISGNDGGGIAIASGGNSVCGNYIGTNMTGMTALGNGGAAGDLSFGILLSGGVVNNGTGINNVIGGSTNAARNVIAGNLGAGIATFGTAQNLIQGNFIGLNSAGSGLLGNGGEGLNLSSAQEHIGGDLPGTGNVIAGNGRVGIRVQDFNGNISGAGGSHTIEGNSIYGNNGSGILIDGSGLNKNNRVSQNSITNNAYLAIDLAIGNLGAFAQTGDGVTVNSLSGLNSTYPNTRLPFPVLDAPLTPGAATGSYATLAFVNAIPAYPVRLEFFASATCDCSGYGEGETYLGNLILQADGTFTFNYTPIAGKPVLTATAIDANGNTSEFSQCVGGPPQTPPVITTQPASQTIAAGASVTFSVAASGTNLSYQWRKNSSNLGGATASNYTIASVTAADAGAYDVVVSDACGRTATSTSATLTIGACPALTVGPAALPSGVVGQAYPAISFTAAGGSNTTVFSLTGTLPNGLSFSNGQLSGTPTQAGSFNFTVTATEGACTSQRNYTLIVGALNLQATGNEGFVALNWTRSGFGTLNGFKLYRAADLNGPYTLLNGAIAANATSVNDNSVTPNTTYFYKLTLVDANNVESAFSNAAAATPVDVVPPVIAHTPLTATQPPNLAIPISATVTDNTGVQSVKLFFRAAGASNYTERAMTASGNLYAATL